MKVWPFRHASLERGLWRAWFYNGQSLEIAWPRAPLALELLIHSDDDDRGSRLLRVGLCLFQAFIPLGYAKGEFQVGQEPAYGASLSREFGLCLQWGKWRRFYDLPLTAFCVEYQFETAAGDWREVKFGDRDAAKTETHPYTYVLKDGTVQSRMATISRRRHIMNRRWVSWIWPNTKSDSIDVEFDAEVGERSGSWKGGCIGCSYSIERGEAPVDTLRRMERERKF